MSELRPNRTLGPDHDTFWAYTAQGELRLQKCDACGHYAWPVVQACEQCGSTGLSWARMSGRGRIVSWCTFEREYYKGTLPIPWDTIMVELDEGPLFISNPLGFTWREFEPEMAVKVAFIDCHDHAGEFRLPVFERA